MPKIVTNTVYGGFSLSHEGVLAYAERKGLALYPELDRFGLWTYWLVPPEQRPEPQDNFQSWSLAKRAKSNAEHTAAQLYPRTIPRDDPALVAVVEELGREADGDFACLAVVDAPDDVRWEIAEYDGREWVAEQHRTWGG